MTMIERIKAVNRAERIGNGNRRKGQTTSQLPVISGVRNGLERTGPDISFLERLKAENAQEKKRAAKTKAGRITAADPHNRADKLRSRQL